MPSRPAAVLDALGAVVPLLEQVADPAERILAVRAFRAGLEREDARLRAIIRAAIGELRAADPPATWEAIGALLDASAAYAHKLYHTPERTTPE